MLYAYGLKFFECLYLDKAFIFKTWVPGAGGRGDGWVRQRCCVSYVTGASNWDWLTVEQGLLSLQQVRVDGEWFYFFCFFIFIHFPLSPLSLSFISSTISSICLLPVYGRWHKMTHKGLSLGDHTKWSTRVDVSLNPNTIDQLCLGMGLGVKI